LHLSGAEGSRSKFTLAAFLTASFEVMPTGDIRRNVTGVEDTLVLYSCDLLSSCFIPRFGRRDQAALEGHSKCEDGGDSKTCEGAIPKLKPRGGLRRDHETLTPDGAYWESRVFSILDDGLDEFSG